MRKNFGLTFFSKNLTAPEMAALSFPSCVLKHKRRLWRRTKQIKAIYVAEVGQVSKRHTES